MKFLQIRQLKVEKMRSYELSLVRTNFPPDSPVKSSCYCIKQIDYNYCMVYTVLKHRHHAIKFPNVSSETTRLMARASTVEFWPFYNV